MPWPATDNGGRAKVSCIEVPALADGPWGVILAHRMTIPASTRLCGVGKTAQPLTRLWIPHNDLPRDVVVSGQEDIVAVRPNARGWRREGFLGGDGGVPRCVSRAHVRE